jgi:hypothetical protein
MYFSDFEMLPNYGLKLTARLFLAERPQLRCDVLTGCPRLSLMDAEFADLAFIRRRAPWTSTRMPLYRFKVEPEW